MKPEGDYIRRAIDALYSLHPVDRPNAEFLVNPDDVPSDARVMLGIGIARDRSVIRGDVQVRLLRPIRWRARRAIVGNGERPTTRDE